MRGRGLDAGLRGELRLTSPSGRLAVNGTLRAVDGTYQAYGQKLDIERGVLSFAGPVENPRLDIEATRPNLDVRVGVAVTGTALNPRIRLFSEPELSDLDKLSWLVLGRASETTGGADTALLQQAALALLSGEGPGVTDRLIQSIGLDEISVRQTQGAAKDTIVTLGKQISKRWYVGYERGLESTVGTWQLIYRVAQRITVRAAGGRRQRGRRDLDLALEIGAAARRSLGRDVPVGLGDVVLHEGLDRRSCIDARRIEIELPFVVDGVARRSSRGS